MPQPKAISTPCLTRKVGYTSERCAENSYINYVINYNDGQNRIQVRHHNHNHKTYL